jgi:CheY-like chemotaxis protein
MHNHLALIIEDNQDEAAFFAKALESSGFEIEIIKDGGQAISRLAAIIPDLALLDLHLPSVNGTAVLKHIRDDSRLAETPVIIVTGDPLAAEGLRDQTTLALIKPIGFDQLRDLATRMTATASPAP